MSEDKDTKITSVEKPKDPKKVEAGKKLGAMSKQAKEKKASDREGRRELSEAERVKNSESEFCFPNVDPLTAVGVVGVIGVFAYYGYHNFSKKSSENPEDHTVISVVREPKEASKASRPNQREEPKPKRVYRELDTLG